MKTFKTTKRFREGQYLAEVEVELHQREGRPYPTLPLHEVRRLERARKALVAGDLDEVRKHAAVYVVHPLTPDPRPRTDAA